ncbi:2OG-Fe(II) oxygenase superfamily protein [Prosthecobacter debontii]|uniref:2OG-Fe(II) oxygenase superfamily protein n=1 Tax=Prosthecobacter debontii TaxID=48467 RepID=A0A1T4WIJ3_9BACT|nr:cupin-like domain-containing protein [Prosthecobacter debontii]SKA77166.1 2OG-Fe(II) oxygenase superfamily protein [Prosthecobacter debontii]
MNTAAINSFQITPDWIQWIDENLRLSKSHHSIVEAMVEKGCPKTLATGLIQECSQISKRSTLEHNQRFKKTKWILNSLRELQLVNPSPPIAFRTRIDRDEFYDQFYAKNFPVVYRNPASIQPIVEQFSWHRLTSEHGETVVEIQEGRSLNPNFEREHSALSSETKLSEFISRVKAAKDSNDFYMTARNGSVNARLLESVVDTSTLCTELLDGTQAREKVFLWIGPSGTYTPAHHDLTNNLFFQIKGRKEFRLSSSLSLLEVNNDYHCYLSSTLEEIDAARSASGLSKISFTVTLEEGDILFIPLGWWHEVRGLSASISLSATNFRARNDFHSSYQFYGRLDEISLPESVGRNPASNKENEMESWLNWTRENIHRGCDLSDLCQQLLEKGPKLEVERSAPPAQAGKPGYDYVASSRIVPTLLNAGCQRFAQVGDADFQLYIGVDFLSQDLCRSLSEKIKQNSLPSTLTTMEKDLEFRTSSTSHLDILKDPEVIDLDRWIAESLGIPLEYSEPIQGQVYGPGQQFKLHTDYFTPRTPEFVEHASIRGQRTWTFMVYLEAPEEGGSTFFKKLNLAVPCRAGTAVVWNNLKADGSVNPHSLHEGTKVHSGMKVIITKWFRDKNNKAS